MINAECDRLICCQRQYDLISRRSQALRQNFLVGRRMQDAYDSALFPIPHDPRPHSRLWRRVVRQACKSRQNRATNTRFKYIPVFGIGPMRFRGKRILSSSSSNARFPTCKVGSFAHPDAVLRAKGFRMNRPVSRYKNRVSSGHQWRSLILTGLLSGEQLKRCLLQQLPGTKPAPFSVQTASAPVLPRSGLSACRVRPTFQRVVWWLD